MKTLVAILFSSFLFVSCQKDNSITNVKSTPVMVKVDAVQVDGSVISTSIVVVK